MAKRRKKQNPIKSQPITQSYSVSSSQSLVDIIILVHRRFDLLSQCLQSIPAATNGIGYRIIIFDNGSPFEEANDFYRTLPQDIKVIRNKENLGFPKGCNLAFDRGFSPLVFFLNDDVILDPDSLEHLVHAMDDPKVGIAGMKLIFPEHTDLPQDNGQRPSGKIQHVGLATNIRAEVYHQFIGWTPNHPKVMAVHDVYGVTGAALLTRRWLFTKAGKFLEAYGIGTYEDVDYCLSVRKLGYNIVVVQEATGVHHTGATAVTYQIGYPLNENRMIFMQRWQRDLDWSEWIYA